MDKLSIVYVDDNFVREIKSESVNEKLKQINKLHTSLKSPWKLKITVHCHSWIPYCNATMKVISLQRGKVRRLTVFTLWLLKFIKAQFVFGNNTCMQYMELHA